eukprot:scaffold219927_cov15-Tisochrysis_lutea.AAC.1
MKSPVVPLATALKRRRKVLEAEMASLKEKVAVVLDKSINDSKLISALRAEVAASAERRSLK